MAIPAIIHILGEDAKNVDLDEVPNPTHTFLAVRNVRKKDNKPLPYMMEGAEVFLYAWHKITFIEILQDIRISSTPVPMGQAPVTVGAHSGQQTPAGTTVLGFFRDEE